MASPAVFKHGPFLLGDFSNLAEAEIVLKRHGVFEYLIPADEPGP